MFHNSAFFEIAAILSMATVLGIFGQKLRQPLLIMFLFAGILAGPSGFGIIKSYDQIELLAQMGIAVLLFIVGLKLDLNLIRTTGPVALATGLGQILFTSVIGFVLALSMKMSLVSSAYVAVCLTFSSTIIIVKLLSDKKEIDSLHGQIAVGFLIVQDIAAILALVFLTTFLGTAAEEGFVLSKFLIILAKGLGLFAFIAFLMKYILPRLTQKIAHSQEMLIIFALSWAVFLGAGSEWLGFSKEVGAFLAGVSLASTGFREAISTRLTSLRDFLLLFFFIDLGARLNWSSVETQIVPSLILSLFVLVGNPLIVLIIMGLMGYRRRTGFLAGLTVAQISEFSLIVAALGVSIGHISNQTMGLITLVGVVTIFSSTYMILYSAPLYEFLSKPLKIFERRNPYRESTADLIQDIPSVDMILLGLGNYGSAIAENLHRRRKRFIGVDFDPGVLRKWQSRGIPVLYGDITDPEIHELLPLNKVNWIVNTIRSKELNIILLQHLKESGFKGRIVITASDENEATYFEKKGAFIIFRPFIDASEQAADSLSYAMDFLPVNVNWPVTFLEIKILPEASVAGKKIRNLPLKTLHGVTILAVNRSSRISYNPGPDFRIFPGDRLIIVGPPDILKEAEILLNFHEEKDAVNEADKFEIVEIYLGNASEHAGQSLAEIQFRQKFGVTVIGIRRGDEQITAVNPSDKIMPDDRLIVIGTSARIKKILHEDSIS